MSFKRNIIRLKSNTWKINHKNQGFTCLTPCLNKKLQTTKQLQSISYLSWLQKSKIFDKNMVNMPWKQLKRIGQNKVLFIALIFIVYTDKSASHHACTLTCVVLWSWWILLSELFFEFWSRMKKHCLSIHKIHVEIAAIEQRQVHEGRKCELWVWTGGFYFWPISVFSFLLSQLEPLIFCATSGLDEYFTHRFTRNYTVVNKVLGEPSFRFFGHISAKIRQHIEFTEKLPLKFHLII